MSLNYVPRDLYSALGTKNIAGKYTLAEALRGWLEALNRGGERMGVRQIADASGMPMDRVSATLRGRRVPTREELD
ncbi:hypothetical protein, partial [Streptomyces sp. enrichment culture]|uniref:hypothetical protein n=1 Tax=Streptomyces sp. enrichment culture TaxID=1795815 RepID=UPI003F555A23